MDEENRGRSGALKSGQFIDSDDRCHWTTFPHCQCPWWMIVISAFPNALSLNTYLDCLCYNEAGVATTISSNLQRSHGERIDIGSLRYEHGNVVLIRYDKFWSDEEIRWKDRRCEAGVFNRLFATQPQVDNLDDTAFRDTEIILSEVNNKFSGQRGSVQV